MFLSLLSSGITRCMCGGRFGGMNGAVHLVPEAETNGRGGRQTAVLNFQASMRAAVCTKKLKEGSGKREGSANKKQ